MSTPSIPSIASPAEDAGLRGPQAEEGLEASSAALTPEGFVDRAGAAALFGISISQFNAWRNQGRLKCGEKCIGLPRGGTMRIWPIAELERERAAMKNPEGFVTVEQAAALLKIGQRTFSNWSQAGRIPKPIIGRAENGCRVHLYPLKALLPLVDHNRQLREQAAQQIEPYPDPQRSGVVRVPLASGKQQGIEALIDACDLQRVQGTRWNWSGGHGGDGRDAVMSPKAGTLARLILNVVNPELLVVHLNGDKRDCRRANLILRTRSEVCKSRKRPKKWERMASYPDPDRKDVVRVPVLSEKHKGMEAIIDIGDLPLIEGKRWNWSPGRPDPAKDGSVIVAMTGTPKPSLARIILGISDQEQLVCHLNGDRLDCRRANLIVRNRSQVKAASSKVAARNGLPCSSRFKGVHFDTDGGKWIATIACAGRLRQLGRFISEIDAALAYDAAAQELFASHALLNFASPTDAERLRQEHLPVESGVFPPPGMVDAGGASQRCNIPVVMWNAWVMQGRLPLVGERVISSDASDHTLYRIEELNRLQDRIRQLSRPYADSKQVGCYRVPLHGHLVYREAIVDAESLPLIEGRGWHWQHRGDGSGLGQVVTTPEYGKAYPMARVVMEVVEEGFDTRASHRNGDSLDCRRANIIVRSMQQQMFGNRKMGTVNGRQYTSNFKGVSWNKRSKKWLAVIQRDRKSRRLGSYHNELAAAQAYDEAARELFGDHARLNFAEGIDVYLDHTIGASVSQQRAAA